jgi:hypothetical protein
VRVYPAQAVTRRIEALRARTSVLTACAADEALPRTTTASRSMARRRRKRGMRTYMFDEERGFDFCTPSSTRHAVSARWHVKRLLPVVVVLGLVSLPLDAAAGTISLWRPNARGGAQSQVLGHVGQRVGRPMTATEVRTSSSAATASTHSCSSTTGRAPIEGDGST